jgi:hypothetical protein
VDQQEQSRGPRTRRQLLWAGGIAALAFLVIVVCGYVFGWAWTGLTAPTQRTLWDWLKLLVVPLVLALGGYWFASTERAATEAGADRRAQEDALRAYLEQMGALLRDEQRPLRSDSEARILGRAQTLTVLARLTDPDLKARVLQFLYEAALIDRDSPVINLADADLRGANLNDARLEGAYLGKADLSKANLEWANLQGTNLIAARLVKANLHGAHLNPAKQKTDLSAADLKAASLRGADLTEANLTGTFLNFADLTDVLGWTKEQLRRTWTLAEATMPDGEIYDEKRHKIKGSGKDKENTDSQ